MRKLIVAVTVVAMLVGASLIVKRGLQVIEARCFLAEQQFYIALSR